MIIAGAQIFKMAAKRFVDVSEEEINGTKKKEENSILKGTKETQGFRLTQN